MLPGKRPISSNDDREWYWHAGVTPANSPRKCRCIQNKDLSQSTGKLRRLNMDSNTSLQTRIPSIGKGDFQAEVIQALLKKIPDKISPKVNLSPQCIDLRNDVPNITVTASFQSPVGTCLECNEDCNLDINIHNLSGTLSEKDYEPDNSFSDRLSTMATCASERSNYDSLSDFELSFSDDETSKGMQSISLDDRKSTSPLYLGSKFDKFKHQNKTASFDDIPDISSNYPDFDVTL